MSFSRASCALTALVSLLTLSGCGYVHFGKLPAAPTTDASFEVAYTNLGTQNKILTQELALSRKEGDALRAALDKGAGGGASTELTARLSETTRELASLRASYAKLQAAGPGAAAPDPEVAARLAATEDKLASSLRDYTQLQQENARLRAEVDQTRTENTTLAAQVKTLATQNEQAQSALADLNTELLQQKEARARANQQAEAARAQLNAVLANRDLARPPALADARAATASSAATLTAPDAAASAAPSAPPAEATLKLAAAPPSDAAPTAELHTSPERLQAAGQSAAPAPATAEPPTRTYIVQANDTLERIAKKFYNDPAKWNVIYFANNALLSGGRPLKAGMELEIPAR